MPSLLRPPEMFDRAFEWGALERFATNPARGATLGVVSGRRRQGKTFLLRALCQATGGFYFAADEATDAESLRSLGQALGEHLGMPSPLALADWRAAVDALLALGRHGVKVVVIDEFPYLAKVNPALPSILQNAFAPLRRERDDSHARLLLCGSAMSFMGQLLSGNAPLRGRAGLELVVPTLNHQLAAEFWGMHDPRTALKVHAIVGGTPAYRREFAGNDVPSSPEDFDPWVARTVLSPASPLFREARYLLADEPSLHDTGLYHSVLAAIATGSTTRGGIASYLGRKSSDLAHPLTVLQDCGLTSSEHDVFRDNRSRFRVTEPLVTFYHAVMRPIWADLEHAADARPLWARSQRRFESNVIGPHFEQVCREWSRHFAPDGFFDDHPSRVGAGTLNDALGKTTHEVDVAVFALGEGDAGAGGERLIAIGEAKWGEEMGRPHLERLRRIRSLLVGQHRAGAASARLLCFGGLGFTEELSAMAARNLDVGLVGPAALYGAGRPG